MLRIFKKNRIFRKIGFYSDQNGILNRYKREKKNWDNHLEKTKKFILKSAETKGKETVLVFGSGWLLDIPIEELSKQFKKVVLFDVSHPDKVLKYLKKFKNVETVELDLTGYSSIIQEITGNTDILNLIPETKYVEIIKNINADFFVSVNLLNQLDILLVDFITSKNDFSDEIIKKFRKKIQNEHLALLPKNKSCLITDYLQMNYNKDSKINETELIYTQFPISNYEENWEWIFDTKGTYNEFSKIIFKVKGIDF